MLEYYENSLNNIYLDPNEKWRGGQQAVINRLYENTTLKETVEEEAMPFDFKFHKIDAWVDNVTEATLNAEKDDSDYKALYFKDCEHESIRGRYYKFYNNYWIVYSDPSKEESISTVKVRRCNNILKWVDEKGVLYEYPCVIDYSLASTNSQTSRMIQQANSHITVIVQGNENTLSLKRNKRFIFNGTCYRFFAINNYMQNSYVNKETPILFFDFYEEMVIDTDNVEENIADDIRSEFTLIPNGSEIQNLNGYIDFLDITVYDKKGNAIEDPMLTYSSSDTNVVTIDKNGVYKIVGEPNQEAVITVKIKNNDLTRLEVPVRVISGFIDNYTIKISDIPQKLKQGDKITIKANTYNGEEVLEDDISCVPNFINDRYYTLVPTNEVNTWELTCIKPYSKELELVFTSLVYEIEITQSVKLVAMF